MLQYSINWFYQAFLNQKKHFIIYNMKDSSNQTDSSLETTSDICPIKLSLPTNLTPRSFSLVSSANNLLYFLLLLANH